MVQPPSTSTSFSEPIRRWTLASGEPLSTRMEYTPSLTPQGAPTRDRCSEADASAVHRFVARRVTNAADAADIAQQALLQGLANWASCRGESHLPWLLTIARHLIVDYFRKRSRFQFVEAGALDDVEPALRTRRDVVPVACEGRRRLGCMRGCVTQRLYLEEQLAVLLADIYRYRDKESAAVLQMTLPSFKHLLHEARERLHAEAGGSCMLVRRNSAASCDEAAGGDLRRGAGTTPLRRGARCGLGTSHLVELRARLLDGLEL